MRADSPKSQRFSPLCRAILVWGGAGLMAMAASAQQFVRFETTNDREDQLQVLSNDTMTFNTEAGSFDASGDVQVLFGEIVVFGDRVEATFEGEDTRTVREFSSMGDVYFASDGLEGQADRLDADLSTELYVFTGRDVQIVTKSGRILSDQIVVLNEATGNVDVKSTPGNSFLVTETDTIGSDEINIKFEVLPNGETGELETLEARGDVRADFDGTQLAADRLVTDRAGIDVQLFGNVSVRQGSTVLGGDCMIYNTETGDTRLSKCPEGVARNTTGRVTGRIRLSN